MKYSPLGIKKLGVIDRGRYTPKGDCTWFLKVRCRTTESSAISGDAKLLFYLVFSRRESIVMICLGFPLIKGFAFSFHFIFSCVSFYLHFIFVGQCFLYNFNCFHVN